MHGLIVNHAQAVLDVAQEPIALIEKARHVERSDPGRARGAQRERRARRLERGMRVAVHELEVLRGELDVDDAARSGLQIVRAAELGLDPRAHRADRFTDRTRIARRVDGGVRVALDRGPEREIAGDRPELQQRLVLPQLRALGVIAPPRRERRHEQALRATRAEPGVDLVEPAARGARAQRTEEALRELREPSELVVRTRIDEDHVEVRRVAELAPAELAEAEDRERALWIELVADDAERRADARLRDRGELDVDRERIEDAGKVGEPDP